MQSLAFSKKAVPPSDAAAARASFEQSLRLDPNQPRVRAFLEGR
jgi:hypothetical protein